MAPLWAQLGVYLLAIIGCSSLVNASALYTQGSVKFVDPASGVRARTWYRIYGNLKTSKYPPLVLLHGGPGIPSDYLFPLYEITARHKIPIVIYDQIGNGRSTHYMRGEGNAKFWTEWLFRHELTNLLSKLGIDKQPYDIMGHSWGGMLAAIHAADNPPNLRRLIVYSSPAAMDDWVASANNLRRALPQEVQDALTKHEQAGTFSSEEYAAATTVYYEKHLYSKGPYPESLKVSLNWLEKDPTVYTTMNGPSEFTVTGTLKGWSIVERLPRITAPTLVLWGKEDTAQDWVVAPYLQHISNSRGFEFEQSSHTAHLEEPELFRNVVVDFLNEKPGSRRPASLDGSD